LGPTAEGYDNLHWWLGEWAWVYDKYSSMFVQWANVDSPRAPVRPLISQWIDAYSARIVDRLASAGIQWPDPGAAALATVTQLMLFPWTPPEALVVSGSPGSVGGHWDTPVSQKRPEWPARQVGESMPPDRFVGASKQVQATIRRLLDAGGEMFSVKGYHSASVDDIVRQAGLGRGTFYKYFHDKLDLLVVLAEEAVQRLRALNLAFSKIRPGRQASGEVLRAWLQDFLSFHRRYNGVYRAWQERNPDHPALQGMGQETASLLLATFDEVLGQVRRTYPLNVPAGSMILLAFLEHLPDQIAVSGHEMPDPQLAELMATVIERGLFNGPNQKRSPALA
jgi:AcrR family transcriptional regulator